MPLQRLHRAVDEVAMWVEDRVARPPAPFRPAPTSPLACFGPLPELPTPPDRTGPWTAPSPWPGAAPLEVHVAARERPSRGVVVLVPPWKIRWARLMAGWTELLLTAGYEVWLAVPPFHMTRRAPGTRSGEGFVSPDLVRLRDAVGQLVMELRLLCALASQRGGAPALVGLSLGALGAALAGTTPEAPPSLALVAAPLDLTAVLTRTRIGRRYRRLAEGAGAPLPEGPALAALLAPFDPGARPPVSRRVFLAEGRQDGVATRRGHLTVVHGWGVQPHGYDRGHLTLLFACRQVRADLAAFLAVDQPARFAPA
jgi:hypothetical protein